MIKLLKNAQVFSPKSEGRKNILIAGKTILWMGNSIPALDTNLAIETVDLAGLTIIPGLIDGHVHLTGGGGESGYHSRVPALPPSSISGNGVTTAIGLLGTDDVTRTTADLVTQTRGLEEQGITAYCYCGGYHFPPTTLTGSIRSDIVYIDKIIGVGEIALSDHRSSQLTLNEFLRVASEAHVGGMMTGKAGIVHCHMGDGNRRLELIHQALNSSEIPPRVFNPTHVNRNIPLFEDALELAQRGCSIDITAFPVAENDPGYSAAEALIRCLEQTEIVDRVTVSSDGGGCLPVFDDNGQVLKMDIGATRLLLETMQQLRQSNLRFEQFLPAFTSNVADLLRLPYKGRIAANNDADLIILDESCEIWGVMALGKWHKYKYDQSIFGTFETK